MTERALDVEALLGSTVVLREGGCDPGDVFLASGVGRLGDEEVLAAVRSALRERPDWIERWQGWSYDKRWSPSPYLDELEVGHFDGGRRHARFHETLLDACADFVLTEARWVTERRIVATVSDCSRGGATEA